VELSKMSLFLRAVAINAVVLVVAVLVLALSPATVSSTVTAQEWVVLAVGTALVIAVNLVLLRRVFEPLERLEATMERIDPLDPGRRIAVDGPEDEIARLGRAFNAMLDRVEHERVESGRRALQAQEAERGRLARELHDELGQLLTGVVLQLEGLGTSLGSERRAGVVEIQDAVREGVETVREIAQGLRPPALDEFGLRASLVALVVGFGERSGLRVRQRIDADLPALDRDAELAVYRVAQEALTNVARHARAESVELALEGRGGTVVLSVHDDGCGIEAGDLHSATGVAGMRERALLVGGSLEISGSPSQGTDVRLRVPVG
jgi:two-component system, NarL family, sensor histidine kinase UhpB